MQQAAGSWQQAENGGHLIDAAVMGVLIVALALLSFGLGRNYERMNALAAEPAPAIKIISKAAARAIVQPVCTGKSRERRAERREDLRVPGRGR